MSTQNTIDLGQDRTIAIRDRGHLYTFTVAPIPESYWMKYWAGIKSTSEQRGKELVREFDNAQARLDLVENALTAASGYRGGDIQITPETCSKLPMSHRLAIADVLIRARAVDPQDTDAIELGGEAVTLEVLWDADENGNMRQYRVTHHFATPSVEHARRYMRDLSRSKVVGGSRTGKTIWHGAQATLVEIYNELIQSVEGYSCSGADGFPIQLRMDAYHKVVAAERLFATPAIGETEE